MDRETWRAIVHGVAKSQTQQQLTFSSMTVADVVLPCSFLDQ